jgi:beta-glucosidase
MTKNTSIEASVVVKNTGKVKGKEVVQLYIQDPYASATRPVKELKGFKVIELEAGESQKVTFNLKEKDLAFYSAKQKWESELGTFHVFIGTDSKVKQKLTFELK